MKRIMIVGSAGSGKSTLAQKLGEHYRLPVVHLDRHFWLPDWVARGNDEWDQMVIGFAKEDQWIIDGNYSRTMELRLNRADQIIYLDMPTWLCLARIVKRRFMYHNKTRPDMNEGCKEKLDIDFVKWVWNYRKRSRIQTLKHLEAAKNYAEVIILSSPKQVKQFIVSLGEDNVS